MLHLHLLPHASPPPYLPTRMPSPPRLFLPSFFISTKRNREREKPPPQYRVFPAVDLPTLASPRQDNATNRRASLPSFTWREESHQGRLNRLRRPRFFPSTGGLLLKIRPSPTSSGAGVRTLSFGMFPAGGAPATSWKRRRHLLVRADQARRLRQAAPPGTLYLARARHANLLVVTAPRAPRVEHLLCSRASFATLAPRRRHGPHLSASRASPVPAFPSSRIGSRSGVVRYDKFFCSFSQVHSRAAATEMAVVATAAPEWATKEPCLMGIDEAGRGPVLGPMVYGCMYCARSYQNTLATLSFADSKTLKEEQREELFESLKTNSSIGWEVDVICPKVLSAKMLKRTKINLNEISHNSAMGLVKKALDMGVLLAEVYVDTVGDPEKYRVKLAEKFPGIKFVVAKKADSLYPVVSGASIVAKVTRDRAVRNWAFDETAQNMHMNTGSGYPGDPNTIQWLKDHKHPVFGFPTLVRFSWGTCTPYFKNGVEVTWESDELDEDEASGGSAKRQVKLSSLGFTGFKRKSEEIESSGKARCKFFQARKLELVRKFQ